MRIKTFGKVISVFLSVCMLVSLFTCLAGMQASAANTNMLVFEKSDGGRFVNYRPDTGAFVASGRYLYSFDIDYSDDIDAQLADGTRNDSQYWKINYLNTSGAPSEISLASLSIEKTPLENGNHYDVTFTVPDDCRDYNNISLIFGDYWYNGYDQYFKVGNLDLWSIDSSGNKVSQIALTMPDTIEDVTTLAASGSNSAYKQARTGTHTRWACPKGYRNGFDFAPQNGYFNPIANDCTHENTNVVEAVASTCTTHGHGDYTVCDICGEIIDGDSTLLDLDPDNHEGEIPVPPAASTCSKHGHAAYFKCSGCGEVISGDASELPFDLENHNGEDTYIDGYVAPGRTTDGYTGDVHCKGCDALLESGKPIAAVQPSTTMLVMGENTKLYARAVYRPSIGAMVPGEKYLYSFDLDINLKKPDSDEEYAESDFWRIYYRKNSTPSGFDWIDYANLDITKTALTNGYHYDVVFTAPDDCLDYDNVLLRFGDTVPRERAPHLKVGNLRMWRLDAEGNKTGEEILVDIPDSMSSINLTTDSTLKLCASVGEWYMVKNYTDDVTIVEQEGYFAPIGGYTDCQHTNTATVAAVASTCTTPGHGEYVKCKICGQVISGSAEELPIDPDNHVATERTGLIVATHTEDGYSGDVKCIDCGATIETGYTVPAGTMDSKMIELKKDETTGYTRLTYRPAEGAQLIAGKKYQFTMDLDLANTEADEYNFWRILYFNNTGERTAIPYDSLQINKTPHAHGYTYTVTFTAPEDVVDRADNIIFSFGDCAIAGIAPVMKIANLGLCQLNDSGEAEISFECGVPNIQEEIFVAGQQDSRRNNGIPGRWVAIYGYTKGVNVIDQDDYFADYIAGDIDGSGVVDNKDVTILFQYLTGWDVPVNVVALDVNGDNAVNNKDLTRLFKSLSA